MTVKQIECVFKDKEHSDCSITERLVKAGYQQKNGGYITKAKKDKIEVDYKKALPTQYWHLFESYLNQDIQIMLRLLKGLFVVN